MKPIDKNEGGFVDHGPPSFSIFLPKFRVVGFFQAFKRAGCLRVFEDVLKMNLNNTLNTTLKSFVADG